MEQMAGEVELETEDESLLTEPSPLPSPSASVTPIRKLAPLLELTPSATSEAAPVPAVTLTPAAPAVSKQSVKLPSTAQLFKSKFTDPVKLTPPPKKAKLTPAQTTVTKQAKSDSSVPNFQHIYDVPPTLPNGVFALPMPPSASAAGGQVTQFCINCSAPRLNVDQRFCGQCGAPMS